MNYDSTYDSTNFFPQDDSFQSYAVATAANNAYGYDMHDHINKHVAGNVMEQLPLTLLLFASLLGGAYVISLANKENVMLQDEERYAYMGGLIYAAGMVIAAISHNMSMTVLIACIVLPSVFSQRFIRDIRLG